MAHLLSCFYVLVTDDPGFLQMSCKCSKSLMQKVSQFCKFTYNETEIKHKILWQRK